VHGKHGDFGIYCAGKWAQAWWPQYWLTKGITRDMTFLERILYQQKDDFPHQEYGSGACLK
jgi:hypothetical protein